MGQSAWTDIAEPLHNRARARARALGCEKGKK